MLVNEAKWLERALKDIDTSSLSPLINLGSSTDEFRRTTQPHNYNRIIGPLEKRGVRIVHSDLFDGNGVDVVGSIFSNEVLNELRKRRPKAVLCSNMFEHIEDRRGLALAIDSLLERGGIIVVTVPCSFPYHPDPIDTYFRPSIEEICKMFPEYELVVGEVVDCGNLIDRYKGDHRFMMRQILGSFFPLQPFKWIRNLHHWFWIIRRYKTTAAILRKV